MKKDNPPALGRRDLLMLLGAGITAAGIQAPQQSKAAPIDAEAGSISLGGQKIQFVDLSHRLTSEFNVIPGRARIAMDPIVGSGYDSGMFLNRLLLVEHTGTHIDAPSHFDSEGASLGEMPLSDLIVPLAVIDFSSQFQADPDAALMPDDILDWESRHGRLPEGCCVALHTGWDYSEAMALFAQGVRRGSPGFSPEAAEMLITERSVKGIAVDAMTIDRGSNSPAYPVHQRWLRSGRWGIEAIINLQSVPPTGAVLIVGAAPIQNATGMPIRAIAMF